jgi:hypothetical protein
MNADNVGQRFQPVSDPVRAVEARLACLQSRVERAMGIEPTFHFRKADTHKTLYYKHI